MPDAITDIVAERAEQKDQYSDTHDDDFISGDIALAAACLAAPIAIYMMCMETKKTVKFDDPWPWGPDGYRCPVRTTEREKARRPRRKQLVVAAALIVAEIERLDRATNAKQAEAAK